MMVKRLVKIKGFSLIELLIVLVITGIILSALMFRSSGAISNMSVDGVVGELALAVYEKKEAAITGAIDPSTRTFNLTQALVKPHNGVTVTTQPILGNNDCKAGCDNEANSICVSENSFCFSTSETFIFDRFSGRLSSPHAIFIANDKRTLAILITQSGDHYIAELIGDTWKTRRDLQKLLPKQNNIKPTTKG